MVISGLLWLQFEIEMPGGKKLHQQPEIESAQSQSRKTHLTILISSRFSLIISRR